MISKRIALFNIEDIERPLFNEWKTRGIETIEFTGSPTQEKLASLPKDVEVISICTQVAIDETLLSVMPQLKFISTRSTGYQHIDKDYLIKHGIGLANCRHYCDDSVSEHALMLILNLLKEVPRALVDQAEGRFIRHASHVGRDLADMTVGLWGLGSTGLATLKRLVPFGCRVLVTNRTEIPGLDKECGFEYVSLDSLLRQSDIISLHIPLNGLTRHSISENRLRQMKKDAYLINVARAGLVDLCALYKLLEEGHLKGVGFDVLTEEATHLSKRRMMEVVTTPSLASTAQRVLLERLLMQHPRVLITPHTAYYTESSLKAMTQQTIENIDGYLQGDFLRRVL